MSVGWPSVALVAVAVMAWPAGTNPAVRRARALLPRPEPPTDADPERSSGRRWVLATGAGLAAGLLLGGWAGVLVGSLTAAGAVRLLRADRYRDSREADTALRRDLPVACDLLAVCLGAGVPVSGALDAVGRALPAPIGPVLAAVAGLYRLGAEPRGAWAGVPEPMAGLGRVLVRAGEAGSSAAPALRTVAAESRAEVRAATDVAVRRAGVWVLAPLGLCFLPAFVCLGVVPMVLGIATGVFG